MKVDYFENEKGDCTITLNDKPIAICENVKSAVKLVNSFRSMSLRIDTISKIVDNSNKAVKMLKVMTLSMAAHPDCVSDGKGNSSEFFDLVKKSEEILISEAILGK